MERRKLSEEEARERMAGLAGWKVKEDKIKKYYKFADFAGALAFVNKVGEIAERLDHHPDIKFGWGYAKVKTTTHDRDGVTDFDIELARQVDAIAPTEGQESGESKAPDDPGVNVGSPS
jgi:4a-hydroxytetrahydrobiopterin dehydratase